MLKRSLIGTALISLGLCVNTTATADGANIHGVGGVSLPTSGGQQSLNLGAVTDQFNTTNHSNVSAVWGFGVGYQWDAPIKNKPFAFDLDLTGYYTKNSLSGVQTPAINLISQADTLNYRASESSWAWMIEPKLISTTYAWQPYVVGGLGGSSNRMSGYSETPSNPNSSAVTTNAFANKTTTNLAWELGVGVQRSIYTTLSGKKVVLSGEYRYMDWGPMSLGTTAAQTTQFGPSFDHLKTNLFDLRLSLQF